MNLLLPCPHSNFRYIISVPLSSCCNSQCDKFVDEGEVESSQRALGPGKQMCQGCEEIACMGF